MTVSTRGSASRSRLRSSLYSTPALSAATTIVKPTVVSHLRSFRSCDAPGRRKAMDPLWRASHTHLHPCTFAYFPPFAAFFVCPNMRTFVHRDTNLPNTPQPCGRGLSLRITHPLPHLPMTRSNRSQMTKIWVRIKDPDPDFLRRAGGCPLHNLSTPTPWAARRAQQTPG